MKYKNYNDLMNHTLHQLAAIHSSDMVDNRKNFAHLLLDIYFDAADIPDEDIQREEALKEVLTPLFRAKELAPPPTWKARYDANAK